MVKNKYKNWFSGTFLKAQCSALISTAVDFLATIFLTQVVGLWYLMSSCMGTILGGYVNFSLGRNWAFQINNSEKLSQALRYAVVWSGSLLLNTFMLYLFTEVLRLHYIVSKSIVSVLVGVFLNFYFQKTFVFKT